MKKKRRGNRGKNSTTRSMPGSVPNKPKQPSRFYCSRCGQLAMTFRYMVALKHTRERCSSCGGNLVKRCELPPELNIAIGPTR